jgi:O-antigen ligase
MSSVPVSASVEPSGVRHRDHTPWAKVTTAALPLVPVLACLLGGATQKWAEGIILVVLGLYLIVRPPLRSLGFVTNCAFVVLVGSAAITFLPARWFFTPAWRTAMVQDLGIAIGGGVSPQPWITAGALVSLIAGICWFYRVATIDLDLRNARLVVRLFFMGVVLIAVLSIILYWGNATFVLWTNERGFGPFPNRNQTADLFGITAVVLLASGLDDFRAGRIRWIFALFGLAILLTAVILNFSRAGIAIFVAGCFVWVVVVAFRQRSRGGIALGVSLLLILLTVILLGGGKTLERFQEWSATGPGISSDFRWKIFRDTFQLIRNSPWCGIGLGNFHPVFGFFRKESIAELTVLHPESDWLWLWSEAGWPTVALILISIVLVFRRIYPLETGTNQRLRIAALVAAILFGIHGLVDVSGHRVGTAYAGLFLFGLALHRPLNLKLSRSVPVFFRIMGVLLLFIGLLWASSAKSRILIPGGAGVTTAKRLSAETYQTHDFPETIALTTKAIEWAPLDWELYFRRALAEIPDKKPSAALSDFRRARFLEPVAYELPRDEGTAWLSSQPTLAATAWRDALRKAGRKRPEVFASMLTAATLRNPNVNRILEEFGLNEPDLALAYLGRLSGPAFRDGIAKYLAKNPQLDGLTEPEKLALFDLWSERGDLDELARTIEVHPDWLSYAWLGMAKYRASKQDFQGAYDLTQRFGEPVAMPRASGAGSLKDLQGRYATNPDNMMVGFTLYQAQMQAGLIDDALNTARHFSERASSPPYFHFLEAQSWAAKQNWERAWGAWLAYRNTQAKK